MNKLHVLAGLPRSGTTVLSAILNQNPEMYVPTTSSFVELLWRNYTLFYEDRELPCLDTQAIRKMKHKYLRNVGNLWFKNLTDKTTVSDKRRIWHTIPNIKMYKEVYGVKPKIICTVRDVAEIIVSFIKVFEKNNELFVHNLSLNGEMYGGVYDSLKETFFDSSFTECIHLVEYNDICTNTEETLKDIYDFLEMKPYKHNLKNIQVHEQEGEHYLKDIHNIKSTLTKTKTNLSDYLTPHEIKVYQQDIFWKKNA